ncbi:MAG: hypothetical protein ACOYN3_05425 [Acidimicrobiia bacterium]
MEQHFDALAIWTALPTQAQLAVVALVAEAAALEHGLSVEIPAVRMSWHAVEDPTIGAPLVSAAAFRALTNGPDPSTPPGLLEALEGLLAEPPEDQSARAFLARCNTRDVQVAIDVVATAVTRGTDLTPPEVLQHEFRRQTN